jgi:hypothetical protein
MKLANTMSQIALDNIEISFFFSDIVSCPEKANHSQEWDAKPQIPLMRDGWVAEAARQLQKAFFWHSAWMKAFFC